MTLRKRNGESAEGAFIATYVPNYLFTCSDDFSDCYKSLDALDRIVIGLAKKLPARYKVKFRKEKKER